MNVAVGCRPQENTDLRDRLPNYFAHSSFGDSEKRAKDSLAPRRLHELRIKQEQHFLAQ